MSTSTTMAPAPAGHTTTGRRRHTLTVAGAVAAAAAAWLAARATGTVPTVAMGAREPMTISLLAVILTASAASLAGWAAVSLLNRLTRHARRLWPAVALVTLAASFLPILAVRADAGTRVALATMHLAVAAVLIPGLLPGPRGARPGAEGGRS